MGYKGYLTFTLLLFFFSSPNHLTARCLPAENQPLSNNPKALTSPAIISELQRNLREANLFQGDISGEIDEEFVSAIRKFQKQSHMPVDGEISEPLRISLRGRDNLPPDTLHAQAASGQMKNSVRQISENPQLNARDEQGWTPLLYAVLYGQKRAVSKLLRAGANVDQASKHGATPLIVAVIMNRPYILGLLLNQWSDLDLPNHNDESAEGIAFNLKRHRLLRQFRRHREAMKWARLGRIPPFKVRMISWDWQECYRATTARINVDCQIDFQCNLRVNALRSCNKKGDRYMQRLVRIVQKKWGGKPKVLTDTQPDIGGPLDCQEGDVVIFAVRAH